MCLIVDANVVAQVFTPRPTPAFQPVWDAIAEGRAKAVHGGHLTREYAKVRDVLTLVLELERQGKVRREASDRVEAETELFRQDDRLVSDDPHVLGLARAANVRLLCSHDKGLHADFTNPALLNPAGSVYQDESHVRLLRRHCTPPKKKRRAKKRG